MTPPSKFAGIGKTLTDALSPIKAISKTQTEEKKNGTMTTQGSTMPANFQNSILKLTHRGVWISDTFFVPNVLDDLIELSPLIRDGKDAVEKLFSIHVFNLKFIPTTVDAVRAAWNNFVFKIGEENILLLRKIRLASPVDRQGRHRNIYIGFGAPSTLPIGEVQIRFHDGRDGACSANGLVAEVEQGLEGFESDTVECMTSSGTWLPMQKISTYKIVMKGVNVMEMLDVLGQACLGYKLACPSCMFADIVRWHQEARGECEQRVVV